MPRKSGKRCSVRKLFDAIDTNHSGDVSLAEVTKAFKKAAGKDQRLTYAELRKSCRKYSGNAGVQMNRCRSEDDCMEDEQCVNKQCRPYGSRGSSRRGGLREDAKKASAPKQCIKSDNMGCVRWG